jgi:hypothetical protein
MNAHLSKGQGGAADAEGNDTRIRPGFAARFAADEFTVWCHWLASAPANEELEQEGV